MIINSVEGVDDDARIANYADTTIGVGDWLAKQRIGLLRITSPTPGLVDIDDPVVLDHLDGHPRVRQALNSSGLGTPLDPARLDSGIIRLGGPVGRPITQAVSRAAYEWIQGVDGIGYWSRLDSTERCWALYDHVPVEIAVSPLNPASAEHRRQVQTVSARFQIALPDSWA